MTYETDDEVERALAWRDEICSGCSPAIERALLQFGAEVAEYCDGKMTNVAAELRKEAEQL